MYHAYCLLLKGTFDISRTFVHVKVILHLVIEMIRTFVHIKVLLHLVKDYMKFDSNDFSSFIHFRTFTLELYDGKICVYPENFCCL